MDLDIAIACGSASCTRNMFFDWIFVHYFASGFRIFHRIQIWTDILAWECDSNRMKTLQGKVADNCEFFPPGLPI